MEERQWEYCELGVDGHKYHKPKHKDDAEGWSYDCHVRYYISSGTGGIYIQLTKLDSILKINPFAKAMALLGTYGWELVSVQHPVYGAHGADGPGMSGYMNWTRKVAYFKRPVVAGRAVDQPKLIL